MRNDGAWSFTSFLRLQKGWKAQTENELFKRKINERPRRKK